MSMSRNVAGRRQSQRRADPKAVAQARYDPWAAVGLDGQGSFEPLNRAKAHFRVRKPLAAAIGDAEDLSHCPSAGFDDVVSFTGSGDAFDMHTWGGSIHWWKGWL